MFITRVVCQPNTTSYFVPVTQALVPALDDLQRKVWGGKTSVGEKIRSSLLDKPVELLPPPADGDVLKIDMTSRRMLSPEQSKRVVCGGPISCGSINSFRK